MKPVLSTIALLIAFLLIGLAVPAQSRPAKTKILKGVPAATPNRSTQTAAKCTVADGPSQDEIVELLADHNAARALLDLPPLKWDCRLVVVAQAWARNGKFEHRTDTEYGENLFVSSRSTEPISSIVEKWMGEKVNYDPKTGRCIEGKVCTHYSQLNWRTTRSVGCGINRNVNGSWRMLVVCNYDPAGNTGGPAY